MNKLDIRKYTSTFMVKAPVAPWIVNPNCLDRLQTNAAFINHHKTSYQNNNKTWHIRDYKNSLQEFDPTKKSDLYHFGIKTNQYKEGGKVNREDFDKLYTTSELSLCSERFFSPDFMCQGSSRHALLYDVQLKGVGSNHLNFNQDFHHRWGGFLTRDALRAVFNNEVINARTPLGASEILGLFIYQEKTFKHISECIQVRDAQSYRLAQLYPGTTVPEDRRVIRDYLDQKFEGISPEKILEKIFSHYVISFQNGVQCRSISYDNLLIDGVFIDSESIDFTADKSQAPHFIKIFIPGKIDVVQEDVNHYFNKYECYLYSSWMHDLRIMHHMNTFVYDDIFKSNFYDDDFYKSLVCPLALDIEETNILKYNSFRETELLPPRQGDLRLLIDKDLAPFRDYKVVDFYENVLIQGTVVTFVKDRNRDLRLETVQEQNKLEVLLYSEFDKLSLEKSYENYQILQKSVQKFI